MTSRIPSLLLLTSEEFAAFDPARRLLSHEHPRRWAALDLGGVAGRYALSWRSDLVEPVVALAPGEERIWLAVDERVACVDLRDGEVRLRLPLLTPVLDVGFAGPCGAVLTETHMTLFNEDLSIRAIVALPGLPTSMTGSERALTFAFLDGGTGTFDLETGRFVEG